MKIAQISPLYESVPPKMYGGTERVVSYLTEALMKLGHDVTLFASGDSTTSAKLIPVCKKSLRLDTHCTDQLAYHFIQLQQVIERIHEFDFIHFHTDYLHFPFSQQLNIPFATTLHGRLNIEELRLVYETFPTQSVISISNSQRSPLPQINWVENVYHGLPGDLFHMGSGKGGYLAFLGRISPEKRLDRAIRMAVSSGKRLKIAAKIDKADVDYFEREIKSLLKQPGIEFIGEINDSEKQEFLGNAEALLFPIDWPEPFGLVMIEAMACGTPVIAFKNGSVPEVMCDGITGNIVSNEIEGTQAISHISKFDRKLIRQYFESNFTAERMARDYISIYENMISQNTVALQSQKNKISVSYSSLK